MSETVASDTMKGRMAKALKSIMAKKPLDKVTIRELADECGVNRQTFYYHFRDIYDLVRWMYEQEIKALIRRRESTDNWKDTLEILFDYLKCNKAACLSVYNSAGYRHLKRFFREILFETVKKDVFCFADAEKISEGYLNFAVQFYTMAFEAVLESYLTGELENSPSELVSYLEELIENRTIAVKNEHLNDLL